MKKYEQEQTLAAASNKKSESTIQSTQALSLTSGKNKSGKNKDCHHEQQDPILTFKEVAHNSGFIFGGPEAQVEAGKLARSETQTERGPLY